MKRRNNEEGTVYEYPAGSGVWYAQLPPDRRGRRPKRRAGSKKDALTKLKQMQHAEEQGLKLTARRVRVNELLDDWLEQDVRRTVKQSTFESYTEIARLYIRPTLGRRWAHELETLELQAWVNELSDRYSANVVRNAAARFSAALNAGVRWGKFLRNPAVGVKLPRSTPRKRPPPTREQVQAWLDATREHRIGPMYLATAVFGLRVGEVLGLHWAAYDEAAGTILIDQQVQELSGKIAISPSTKSETSQRLLPVTPRLTEVFAEQREVLAREREYGDWKEHDLIFPSERGTPLAPTNINRHLREVLKANQLPHWSMHDFRHFTATRLTDLGVQEHVIGAILGHAPGQNITRRYAHVTIETMRQVLTALEADILRRAS